MFSSLVVLSLVSSLSADATPFLCGTDPATCLAIELCIQRVELDEMQTLYCPEHPAVGKRQRRVRAMEHFLDALRDQGYQPDEKRVDGALDALLQGTKAQLEEARQELTPAHPRLDLLELRIESLGRVAARRALAE